MATARFRPPPAARSDGPAVGRPFISADVAAIRPQPVVARREVIVRQRRGEGSAAIQAVAPTPVTAFTDVLGVNPPAPNIRVTWPGTGADDYTLRWRTKASYDRDGWTGGMARQVPGGRNDYQEDFAGRGGTAYIVGVSATRAGDTSTITNSGVVIALYVAPVAPANFKAEPSTTVTGQVDLSWNVVGNANIYEYQVRTQGSAWPQTIGQVTTGTTHTFQGTAGTTYEFRVRAVRTNAVIGAWSTTESAEAPELAPAVPTNPQAAASTTVVRTIDFTWTKSARATNYDVEWRIKGVMQWTLIENVGDVDARAFSELRAGAGIPATTYEFRVRAVNANGDSDWTEAVEATATFNAPAGLTLTELRRDSRNVRVRASWTVQSGVTAYQLQARWAGADQADVSTFGWIDPSDALIGTNPTLGSFATLSSTTSSMEMWIALNSNAQVRVRGAVGSVVSDWSTAGIDFRVVG